ncbi:hypothetical protein GQ457_13G015400 [Hibiscus cannabinus]
MTKNNPQEPLYNFDPKIERIQRRLRTGIRNLMVQVDGQHENAAADHVNPLAPVGVVVNPLNPQVRQEQPVIIVEDYLEEDLDGLNPTFTIPEFEAEHFELKLVMFNMLNTLGLEVPLMRMSCNISSLFLRFTIPLNC